MRYLVFDSGPIISLALNNLLWVLNELKKHYKGKFIIPPEVKREVVEIPLQIRRYKFEAFQVLELLSEGVLSLFETENLVSESEEALELANTIYYTKGHPIKILQRGETQALILAKQLRADAIVVDERTTRMLVEQPEGLKHVLSSKLHSRVELNKNNLARFNELAGGIRVIRSVELVTVAYELGILDRYLQGVDEPLLKNPRREMLEASLWGLKLKGATVSQKEIEQILKLERV
ncbi:hypothetical protein DRJ48_04405 [Candidatus Woesearchaeota archaeon]|nr:hypothetical protein [Candidatus Woesearchaeota archaeon]RLE42023.1 MAG: hypothetical protein DRJ48_04405 [Candidatus Woesearchaeota archaeon]